MLSSCAMCDTEIEVQMCCSGYMCGCQGMPVDPPVCSNKCYDDYMDQRNKVKSKPVVVPDIIASFNKTSDIHERSYHALLKYELKCHLREKSSLSPKKGETMKDYADRYGTTVKEMKKHERSVEKELEANYGIRPDRSR